MSVAKRLLKEGDGVFRLKPTWVPRSFCRPGKRIKLHPDDYYVLGLEKGGIDELLRTRGCLMPFPRMERKRFC